MATFIEIHTDAFAANVAKAKSTAISYAGVRRPLRGIEIKEDTYAVMKVIKADGTEIPLTDSGGELVPSSGWRKKSPTGAEETPGRSTTGGGDPVEALKTGTASTYNYSNFIIQRIDESRQEKSQILETFGDSYIFFFGERPRLLNVSGVLFNTTDFNWRTEFWYNYENVFRGTKLVEQNARIYLFWDDIVVEGYMLQAAARDDSEMPYHIPFNFTLFVTAHTYIGAIGNQDYPVTHAVNIQPLLQSLNVQGPGGSIEELKAKARATQEWLSSTEAVRSAAEAADLERQLAAGSVAAGVGKAMAFGKNLITNALAIGLNAQNLTFLSIVNHLFKNRKMRFPKGIAGSDSYAGPPQLANDPGVWEANPQRVLPYRSKIRDNIDEYVDYKGPTPAVFDEGVILQAELDTEIHNKYLLEKQALLDLAALGLDPVQHPGGSPFISDAAMSVVAATADIALFAAGTAGIMSAKPPTKTRP